ncbi:hypothetical protein GCM10028791_16200 [Echinicola sediminis]
MKNNLMRYIFLILSLSVIFSACNPQNESKVRRFTFVLPRDIDVKVIHMHTMKQLEIEVYQNDGHTFLLVDAPTDYNHEQLMEDLEGTIPNAKNLLMQPLERIYKLEQKNEYRAKEGQLVDRQPGTKRFVLTLEIVNDPELLKMYKQVHGMGMAWPEITKNMKQVGVRDMEIYLDGYQAYLVMNTKSDFDWEEEGEQWGKLPREQEWQEYVAKFQKIDPKSQVVEKWNEMNLIN